VGAERQRQQTRQHETDDGDRAFPCVHDPSSLFLVGMRPAISLPEINPAASLIWRKLLKMAAPASC
jgi:hypothetical protein